MLYRVKGLKQERGNYHWDSLNDQEVCNWNDVKKIYYIEATTFQKATTKAKKFFDTIQEVRLVEGEILDE